MVKRFSRHRDLRNLELLLIAATDQTQVNDKEDSKTSLTDYNLDENGCKIIGVSIYDPKAGKLTSKY